jgi:hypothetical protein
VISEIGGGREQHHRNESEGSASCLARKSHPLMTGIIRSRYPPSHPARFRSRLPTR